MELWEFNACIKTYNEMKITKGKEQLSICWQIASFVGAAFAGKLKKLSHYLKESKKTTAPKISKEEFEAKLKSAEDGRNINVT